MRDIHQRDYRSRTLGAILARLIARIKPRLPRFERRAVAYCARRGADGYDYITPTPNGAAPMSKRRAK